MGNYKSFFNGKKITLMGLGLLGRGVGDAKFLAELGADLIVTDLKSEAELKESVDQLRPYKNIQFVLGEHRLEDFQNRDLVIKAAGVPLDSPYIAEAKKHDIPVRMSADLFAEFSGIKIVGVTGTRGKSTTTALIYHILQTAGKKVLLGGNVKGVSTLSLLPQVASAEIAVLELDSWQLQGFGEAHMSPQIAVFTNFMDDHLNYYKGDRDAYLNDKAHIFRFQKESDTLVMGEQVSTLLLHRFGSDIQSAKVIASAFSIPTDWKIRILGEHNRDNVSVAIEAARALGIEESVIKQAVEQFTGVHGRLEFLREVRGIAIFNDTTATTPDATIAALKALHQEGRGKNTILIMGGSDKQLSMAELIAVLPAYAKTVVLLPGTGTETIKEAIKKMPVALFSVNTLEDAVKRALEAASAGDRILFSPAFASFGMFKNEFDRGDQFVTLVHNL
jgi:UDP-N-acetylmuramoylalanine--D-glutamate ligase